MQSIFIRFKSSIRQAISFLELYTKRTEIAKKSDSEARDRLLVAHQRSPYSSMPFDTFVREFRLIESGQQSAINFNEAFYLAAHEDVVTNIEKGIFSSGFEHFCLHGADEKRIWSNNKVKTITGKNPNFPKGDISPRYMFDKTAYPRCTRSSEDQKKRLIVLFDNLQKEYYYAGFTGFFKDFRSAFGLFDEVWFSVENPYFESELVTCQVPSAVVVHASALINLPDPTLIITFSNITTNKALEIYNDPEKIIYYCQEFEAGFVPFSTRFIDAEKAILCSKNIIISTKILYQYLKSNGFISTANVLVTSPEIKAFEISKEKHKRIFMYFRPEKFHQRNLPELIWQSAMKICDTHEGFEIYLCGTVNTCFSFDRNNNQVFVLSKLPNEQYISIISTCDVVVSLIYAPHPGVIAFQAASSGIPSITNIYSNRDAKLLSAISENIIPFNPYEDSLTDTIEKALQQNKGTASFNTDLYGLPVAERTINEYMYDIIMKR